MVAIPSFFSFSWSLPSLPSISLPANIQRRFLSYVLKRALGRFVRAGGLDVERIQAQISEGWVEIEGLEVNTEEVNLLLPPSLPLNLKSGSLSKVTARVPFPNLWSDPLSITLDTVSLDFNLCPTLSKGKAPETPPGPRRLQPEARPSPLNLANSVTSAADDFLHEELDAYEEAELDQSIRQSLILSKNDPFARQDEVPGAFPGPSSASSPGLPMSPGVESTTVLAGLVERILARLQFRVKNIRVRVQYDHDRYGAVFEFRVGEISYADETKSVADGLPKQTTRAVRISSVEVYMLSAPQQATPASDSPVRPRFTSTTSRSSSNSSWSSSESDAGAELYMSQAVADLRQSTATSLASGASIYQSATGASVDHSAIGGTSVYRSARGEAAGDDIENALEDDEHSRSSTPTPSAKHAEQETLVLSFGSEDIVLQMTTTAPTPPIAGRPLLAAETHPSGTPVVHAQIATDSAATVSSVDIQMTCGTIGILLLPTQIMCLTAALQSVTQRASADLPGQSVAPEPKKVVQPQIRATLRMKALFACSIYDMGAAKSPALTASAAAFWNKPSTSNIPFGHIKARVEGLVGSYASEGYISKPSGNRTSLSKTTLSRPASRRKSTSAQLGPPPPTIVVTLSDASIFEYLSIEAGASRVGDEPPGGAFPVLLFDHGLAKQYDIAPVRSPPVPSNLSRISAPSPAFPEFECVDWRNSDLQRKQGGGEKAWKVKSRSRGVLKGISGTGTEEPSGPVVSIVNSTSNETGLELHLASLHVFLDLSLVERLLPMLRSIAPVFHSPQPVNGIVHKGSIDLPLMSPTDRTSQFVIDDLEAQASERAAEKNSIHPSTSYKARCPLIRLDIRCPAPLNRRGSWGAGAHLRSGIVTLDIHGFEAKSRPQIRREFGRPAMDSTGNGATTTIAWQKMMFFFCRVPDKQNSAFLVIGPLAPDPGDDSRGDVLLPTVGINESVNPTTKAKTQSVIIRVPCIQAKIQQRVIEGLQFFADDMTHWLDGAFGDGSAPKPRDDLKMIGSRFFGAKTSSSASSTADEDDEDDHAVATVLQASISEVDIALHVPRLAADSARLLNLHGSDVDVKVESNLAGKKETTVSVSVMNAEFSDKTDPVTPLKILARTTPLSLALNTQPLLELRFSSLTDTDSGAKETGIDIIGSSFTVFATKDYEWIREIATFAKTPEGVFEDVVPSEVTRIKLQLYDTSVHVAAPNLRGAVVAVFVNLEVKTDVVSDAEESGVDVHAEGIHMLLIDDTAAAAQLSPGHRSSLDAWRRAGYAPFVEAVVLELQLSRSHIASKEIVLDVIRNQVRISACADSIATFGQLLGDLSKLAPTGQTAPERETPASALAQSIDVFASVDESAFTRVPEIISGADLIEDDLPTNLDYLDQATRHLRDSASVDRVTGETLRTWEATGDSFGNIDAKLRSEVNGETVKILIEEAFDLEEDYWDNMPLVNNGFVDDTRVGNVRVRLQDCSVHVFLHDGFDWQKTRKVIEDEIKAVRRRLEKIRQLLAAGQKADESVERTGSMLFNSVYIGLDQSRGDLDSAALLAAIDEELEELGADTASQSSWQTNFPPATDRPTQKKIRLKGRRLTRSKKAQIEFSLSGIKADVDFFSPLDAMASRVHLTVKEFEILDHIKTSTWKKFLTEMKADSRGNVRETDADMVRVELVAVRPSLPMTTDQELRLRAKVLPLRLHIDQDALDFLKRFGNFSAPIPDLPPAKAVESPKRADQEPFFQHVEIFPIELKLDYKPKRVDFGALREGKTSELMNFFHFDGAEMTLRHITLSGVTGVTRLSNLLQDIWTPDVKANQLADVISGVSPIRSMVNVGSGVADLILLPIEQYRKDGRVARGVQRGTNSFVRSTALEMMKLGARLATGTQVILEKAEGVLGGKFGESVVGEVGEVPGHSAAGGSAGGVSGFGGGGGGGGGGDHGWEEYGASSDDEVEVVSRFANQPGDVREGVQAAYQSLSRNVNAAAQTILAVPMEVYERSGEDGPLKAVVRAVPIAVLKPMIGASEAVSKTLLGMRNSLDPQGRREQSDKYK